MKFRFCWDCDCPDWILAELSIFPKIKPHVLKDLALHIAHHASKRSSLNFDLILELFTDLHLEMKTLRAIVASVRWILSNAAGAEVESKVLNSELQQLGLTKDHSTAISNIYESEKENLQKALKKSTLQASENIPFIFQVKKIHIDDENHPMYQLELQGKLLEQEYGYFSEVYPVQKEEKKENTKVVLGPSVLDGLINELEGALHSMEEMSQSNNSE